jgi:hypothetical protein
MLPMTMSGRGGHSRGVHARSPRLATMERPSFIKSAHTWCRSRRSEGRGVPHPGRRHAAVFGRPDQIDLVGVCPFGQRSARPGEQGRGCFATGAECSQPAIAAGTLDRVERASAILTVALPGLARPDVALTAGKQQKPIEQVLPTGCHRQARMADRRPRPAARSASSAACVCGVARATTRNSSPPQRTR